jgi:hypothetical protein
MWFAGTGFKLEVSVVVVEMCAAVLFSSTPTVDGAAHCQPLQLFRTTTSGLPSPFTSATAMEVGSTPPVA